MSRFADPAFTGVPGSGDRVLVAGLGLSGIAAIRAVAALGARVHACDDAGDEATARRARDAGASGVTTGGMDPALAQDADVVIVSPGIPPHGALPVAARAGGVAVWSEVELGWRLARVPVIGVTGTNGKTTTTAMLAAALATRGAVAAGNIGLPLCDVAAGDAGVIVAELSSFQLHHVVAFHAPVAVLLNLAPDHLDWHGSFQAYAADKARLFAAQREGDVAVVFDDPVCRDAAASQARMVAFRAAEPPPGGAGVGDGWIVVPEGRVCRIGETSLRGGALLADAVAAAAAACAFGVAPAEAGEALRAFRPAEHRMEPVDEVAGVRFVNDSKATNPHATLAALQGLERVVLIAGGRAKGLDLSPVARAPGITCVVAIGEAAPQIEDAFAAAGVPVARAASMDEAVERAAAMAQPGDTVLLSPACASYDMFADYRARGEAFRAAVKRIRRGGTP